MCFLPDLYVVSHSDFLCSSGQQLCSVRAQPLWKGSCRICLLVRLELALAQTAPGFLLKSTWVSIYGKQHVYAWLTGGAVRKHVRLIKEFSQLLLTQRVTEWCLSWPAFLGWPHGKPRATRESHEEGVRLHAFPESLTLANNLVSGPRFTLVPLRVVARCGSDVGVAFGMGSGKWWLLEKNGDWSCSHSTFGQHFASPYESLLWTCCREDICNSFLPFFFFF